MEISSNIGINSNSFCIGGSSIDTEYAEILRKLISLGITPVGNKTSDKAKLREYEMRELKNELGSNGKGCVNKSKFITISSNEIAKIKEDLQNKAKQTQESPEFQEKKKATENKTGAEQEALLNRYFITKKKSIA